MRSVEREHEIDDFMTATNKFISFGIVIESKFNKVRVKVGEGIETDFIHVLYPFANSNKKALYKIKKDTPVCVLCPYGDLNQGVVIGSLFKEEQLPEDEKDQISWNDGETKVSYDDKDGVLDLVVKSNGKVNIKIVGSGEYNLDAKTINITGATNITGKTTIKGATTITGKTKIDGITEVTKLTKFGQGINVTGVAALLGGMSAGAGGGNKVTGTLVVDDVKTAEGISLKKHKHNVDISSAITTDVIGAGVGFSEDGEDDND